MPKHHTKEHIEKTTKANIGKKRTEEQKQKMRDSQLKGENRHNYGKPLSDETKKKLSVLNSGERNTFFGKKHPEELMKRISEKTSKALKGRMPKNIDIFRGSYWWNDGQTNKRNRDCPGENWVKGKTSRKRHKILNGN